MKKTTLLNGPLSAVIATMGHTDGLTVGDAGLPVPEGPQRIDLAVTRGLPGFLDVLKATLDELFVERVVIAAEVGKVSPDMEAAIRSLIAATAETQGSRIAIDIVPHEDLKRASARTKAVVRTGECTPYANVILYSGVPF